MTTSTEIGHIAELHVAIAAVREAALLCGGVHACRAVQKTDRSPVTVADFGSQALICRRIRAAFPADPIVAEEDSTLLRGREHASVRDQVVEHVERLQPGSSADDVLDWVDIGCHEGSSGRFWAVDPLDGTKGFLRGGHYAVAIALVVDGRAIVAALACPHIAFDSYSPGSIFAATRGGGASWLSLKRTTPARRISTSQVDTPSTARFCESVESMHSSHELASAVAHHLGLYKAPVRLDSQAKYAVVASGQADIYFRLPTRPGYRERIWDHVPGSLITEEAGGRVTDISGKPLELTHGKALDANRGVVATNGHLHNAVLDAIAAVVSS